MQSVIDMIMAKAAVRMNEALERLKAKIISNLPEEAVEELGDINISSFSKKSLKALEQDIIDIKSKGEEEEGTTKKTKKTKKDKNAPKGAKNAYILFCAENREQVKEDNSEMNAKEIISELARLWKEADEDVKAEYNEKAAADKKRYQQEMSDYVPSEDEEPPKDSVKSKKDPNAPKGAKNAYILFCADHRAQVKEENPEMNAKEIICELARLWKEADHYVKTEYNEKAAADKQRYQEEMSDYSSDEETKEKKEKSKGSPKKDPNAPKGAKNAYMLFCAENREQVKEDNSEMNAKEIISELARLWKEADEDVKAEYQEKAAADKQRYQEEMNEYNGETKVESPKKGAKGSKKVEEVKVESPKKGAKGSKKAEEVKVEEVKVESPKKGAKGSKKAEEVKVEEVKVESPKKGAKVSKKAEEVKVEKAEEAVPSKKGGKGSKK
jgi:HMG (high mobility group) box